MSNFKLGIFDYLGGYLAQAYESCVDGSPDTEGVDIISSHCKDNTYQQYYMAKYYPKTNNGAKPADVPVEFVKALAKFALNLRKYDNRTGKGSIKQPLTDTLTRFFFQHSPFIHNAIITDNFEISRNDHAEDDAGGHADDAGGHADHGAYVEDPDMHHDPFAEAHGGAVGDTYDQTMYNLNQLKNALSGTIYPIKMSQEQKNALLQAIQNLNPVKNVYKETDVAITPENASTINREVLGKVIKDIEEQLKHNLANSFELNYTTAGNEQQVKKLLAKLKSDKDIPEIEMKLFNAYLNVQHNNGDKWEEVSSNNFNEIDLDKPENYRVNVKTMMISNDLRNSPETMAIPTAPIITNLIPIVPTRTVFLSHGSFPTNQLGLELKIMFIDFYENTTANTEFGGQLDLSAVPRDLPIDLSKWVADQVANLSIPQITALDRDDSDEIAHEIVRNGWVRLDNNTYKREMSDGESIVYKPTDKNFNDLVNVHNNCANTHVFTQDYTKCSKYLTAVLTGDVNQLAEFVKSSGFDWDKARTAINDVHPLLALKTLKSFGFRVKVTNDRVANIKLLKIQSCEDWKNLFLTERFKDHADAITKIKNDVQLCEYLELLVQLVNANPSILNEKLVVETEESVGFVDVPSVLKSRGVTSLEHNFMDKPVNNWNTIQENMNKVYGTFSRGLDFGNNGAKLPFGMDNLFPNAMLATAATPVIRGATGVGSFFGGGDSTNSENPQYDKLKVFKQAHKTGPGFTNQVALILTKLLKDMESSSNNVLSPSDQHKITERLGKFLSLEQELYETAFNIQKFTQLSKALGDNPNKQYVSEKHIENYVNKYKGLVDKFDKSSNGMNTLISLLKTLVDNNDTDLDDPVRKSSYKELEL